MKLSIIIPAFNEAATISAVIERVRSIPLPVEREIIVCDDGSTDGTAELLEILESKFHDLLIYNAPVNRGKGASIRKGIELACGDIILIQDADLELDPSEHPRLIAPILEGKTNVVYGSRFLAPSSRFALKTTLPNRFLSLLTNILYRSNLTDMETAYKVFRKQVIDPIELRCRRFECEPEITAKLLRTGQSILEIPIAYNPRSAKQGKKIGWKDGVEAVFCLFRYRFCSIESFYNPSEKTALMLNP